MAKENNDIVAKMATIAAELKPVPNDSTNEFQKYRYTSHEALVQAVRELFFAQGLLLQIKTPSCEYDKLDKGYRVQIQVIYTVLSIEGESLEYTLFAEGVDTMDKSLRKAYTAALKTWLLQAFMISTEGDTTDADRTDPKVSHAAPRQAQPQKSPPRTAQPPQNPDRGRDFAKEERDTRDYAASFTGGCPSCHKPFDNYFQPKNIDKKTGKCFPCNNVGALCKSSAQAGFMMKMAEDNGISKQAIKELVGVDHTPDVPQYYLQIAAYNPEKMREYLRGAAAAAGREPQERAPRIKPQKSFDMSDPANDPEYPEDMDGGRLDDEDPFKTENL